MKTNTTTAAINKETVFGMLTPLHQFVPVAGRKDLVQFNFELLVHSAETNMFDSQYYMFFVQIPTDKVNDSLYKKLKVGDLLSVEYTSFSDASSNPHQALQVVPYISLRKASYLEKPVHQYGAFQNVNGRIISIPHIYKPNNGATRAVVSFDLRPQNDENSNQLPPMTLKALLPLAQVDESVYSHLRRGDSVSVRFRPCISQYTTSRKPDVLQTSYEYLIHSLTVTDNGYEK